ncbi:SRPBCC family protein [Nocardia brasiliensis]
MGSVSASSSTSVPAGAHLWSFIDRPAHHASWLTLHRRFEGEPPGELRPGCSYLQHLELLGRPGLVIWTVDTVSDGSLLELSGAAPMRIRLGLRITVQSGATSDAVTLRMDYNGVLLRGTVAETLRQATEMELGKSLQRLRQLAIAP